MYGAPPATAAFGAAAGLTAAWLTATPPATTPATTVATAPASKTVRRLMDPPFGHRARGAGHPAAGVVDRDTARFWSTERLLGRLPDRFLSILSASWRAGRRLPRRSVRAVRGGLAGRVGGRRRAGQQRVHQRAVRRVPARRVGDRG